MEIKQAIYHSSSGNMSQLPKEDIPEFAFVGRSNVGKSSLINMLCNNKSLAKTSSTPGKTQTINLFHINKQWYLVDLPGYGFAQTAKAVRAKFQSLVTDYVSDRPQLKQVFVLIDGRIPLQKIDMEFIEFLSTINQAYTIIVTKTDKAKKVDLAKMLNNLKTRINELEIALPDIIHTSSAQYKGKEEVLTKIEGLLKG